MNSKIKAETYTVNYSKDKKCVIPITIPRSGAFLIDLVGDGEYAEVTVRNEQGQILRRGRLSQAGFDKTIVADAEQAGTYYLEFSTESSKTQSTSFCVYYAPAVGIRLPRSEIYYAAGVSYDAISSYTFKAPSTGYITVDFTESKVGVGTNIIYVCNPIVTNIIPYGAYTLETDKGKGYIGVKKSFLYKDVRNRRNNSEFYASKGDRTGKTGGRDLLY